VCGRFVSTATPDQVVQRFQVDESRVGDHAPDYNVAPRERIYAVRDRSSGEGKRRFLDLLRWGLVPSWAEDPGVGDRMINARAESIVEKPAYRKAFGKRRCIVPADGFYEWQRREGRKQPTYVHRADGEMLAFAGLWEAWRNPLSEASDDPWLRSCVIVTTKANALVAPIHDRMPVVLGESAWSTWLDPENHDLDALRALLEPPPSEWFDTYPVSTLVNKPVHNGPELLEPVDVAVDDS